MRVVLFFLLIRIIWSHWYHWFVIDHRHTNISNIPIRYFESARESFTLHLAYNVYGTQIISGMQELVEYQRNHFHGERKERYFYLFHFELEDGPNPLLAIKRRLPRLRMYAGCPPNVMCGPDDYFKTDESRRRTLDLLKTKMFDYSVFFWGGQLKDMNLKELQDYLDALDNMEKELRSIHGIDVRLIYTTGSLPGSSDYHTEDMYPVEDRLRIHINNKKIRTFCSKFHKYLFDIAAIESHREDGTPCYTNPKFPEVLMYKEGRISERTYVECNGTYGKPDYCPMSAGEICNRKARAFWYLLARMAGYRPYNFIVLIVVGFLYFLCCLPPLFCALFWIFYCTWGYHLMEKDPEDLIERPKIQIEDLAFPEQIVMDHARDIFTRPVGGLQRLFIRIFDNRGLQRAFIFGDSTSEYEGSDVDEQEEGEEVGDGGETTDEDVVGYQKGSTTSEMESSSDDGERFKFQRKKGKGKLREMMEGNKRKSFPGRRSTLRTKFDTSSSSDDSSSTSGGEDSSNRIRRKIPRIKKRKKKRQSKSSSGTTSELDSDSMSSLSTHEPDSW